MLSKIAKVFAFLFVSLIFSFPSQIFAADESFITIVNPVRGFDFWEALDDPLKPVKEQRELIEENELVATWLLRPDVYLNEKSAEFFKDDFEGDELGIFFEITPALADVAKVRYPPGEKNDAHRFFLSGYLPEQRRVLIDTAFEQFKRVFGFYPASVGAWHIDAYSAGYMAEKYGVSAVLIVSDQYSTDRYKVWGAWWGVPYYPSKKHILVPAQSLSDKIPIIVTQWAVRDPVNGYGPGSESFYSVQANDYTKREVGQNIEYFQKLLDIYLSPKEGSFGHITVGLENELWRGNELEFERQIEEVVKRKSQGVRVLTMGEFSNWYKDTFEKLSPNYEITAVDPLGSGKRASWIMNKEFRLGLADEEGQIFLRDLRFYSASYPEPYLLTANTNSELSVQVPAVFDSAKDKDLIDVSGKTQNEIIAMFLPKRGFSPRPVLFGVVIIAGLVFLLLKLSKMLRGKISLIVLLVLGTLAWSLTMVKSGILYPFGMGFWGPNGHDGVWHIALINQLSKFSLENPVFAGESLRNYHFFYDAFLAILKIITGASATTLYFQLMPPILAFLIGTLTYLLVRRWRNSEIQALWATFFVYFGGSFGWIVTLIREGQIGGESMFWANQAISTLINPPFAASLVILLLGLIFFLRLQKKFTIYYLLVTSLLFGVLIQVKTYAGILVICGLAAAAVWQFFREKKLTNLKIFVGTLIVSFLVFLPTNRNAGNLLVFSPFWFPETMASFVDRFYWPRLANAIQAYKATGNLRIIPAELLALAIFTAGNIGTRVLAGGVLLSWLRNWRKLSSFEIFLIAMGFFGFVLPLLFIQRGNPWNTIQFFYYTLFFSGILAGLVVADWMEKQRRHMSHISIYVTRIAIPVLILVGLTVPTTLSTLANHYLPSRPPARISYEELEALSFLEKQPQGAVLTYPFDRKAAKEAEAYPPRPLYLYESTAYVSAFGQHPVFLEDEVNLEITGYNWRERRQHVEEFLSTQNREQARKFLQENRIKYIYWVEKQRAILGEGQLMIEEIFENAKVRIYKVL